jgi:hypothetical protein
MAVLPDVIGQTVGSIIGRTLTAPPAPKLKVDNAAYGFDDDSVTWTEYGADTGASGGGGTVIGSSHAGKFPIISFAPPSVMGLSAGRGGSVRYLEGGSGLGGGANAYGGSLITGVYPQLVVGAGKWLAGKVWGSQPQPVRHVQSSPPPEEIVVTAKYTRAEIRRMNATNAYLNADLSINLSRRMNERAAARTQSRPSAPAKTQNPFAGQTISQGRIGGPSTLDNLKTNIAARSAQSSNPLRAMPTPSLMDQGIMNGAASIMDGFNMASSAAMGTMDTLTSYGNVANPGDRLRTNQLNAIAALAAPVLGSVGRMEGIGSVVTPYGPALQSSIPEAIAARTAVQGGTPLYRLGTIGKSEAAEAQFWALEHPLNPGFAARYGIPPANVAKFNFIETATLKPGTPFVTRPAPRIGSNPGGGIEVVVPPKGVMLKYFGGH